jgi:hypothetical protein
MTEKKKNPQFLLDEKHRPHFAVLPRKSLQASVIALLCLTLGFGFWLGSTLGKNVLTPWVFPAFIALAFIVGWRSKRQEAATLASFSLEVDDTVD